MRPAGGGRRWNTVCGTQRVATRRHSVEKNAGAINLRQTPGAKGTGPRNTRGSRNECLSEIWVRNVLSDIKQRCCPPSNNVLRKKNRGKDLDSDRPKSDGPKSAERACFTGNSGVLDIRARQSMFSRSGTVPMPDAAPSFRHRSHLHYPQRYPCTHASSEGCS